MQSRGYRAWQFENSDGARDDVNSGSFWVFFVSGDQGHVQYDLWAIR